MFTLNGIKAVDNQVFIFKFVTNDIAALDVFDTVQLIVKGKNFYYVMNFCFVIEGSLKFWNEQVIEFQQFWKEIVVALPLKGRYGLEKVCLNQSSWLALS